MRAWRVLVLTLAFTLTAWSAVQAGVPPDPSRTLPELVTLFPSTAQLSPGLVLQESGERTEADIAATFPDSVDAAQILHVADWLFNAYRVYVAAPGAGPDTPARLEISLHQFSSPGGAAYAMPYFVHGRAVVLGRQEVAPWDISSPCAGAVLADHEATRYQRIGDLLVRVTAVASDALAADQAYVISLTTVNAVMETMIAATGSSRQLLDQTCQ